MASGSSQAAHSTSAPLRKHDVFLSFYGEDTRKGFSDHLYSALKDKGIFVYRDDEELKRGENISALLKAIQKSEYAVVVISENYAFSKWCLKELAEIVKCKREHHLTILPIFYHVDPSNVRNQKASFADGLATHGEESKEEKENWRSALKEVGNIAGWHVHISYESTIVQEVCREISIGLTRRLSNNFKDVMGIESQVKEMMILLRARDTTNDVHFIGICGMGGIGKTTLAQVIFDSISSEFEARCFVDNVREKLKRFDIVHLQEQIVYEILGDRGIKLWDCFGGIKVLANRLRDKKIFLVLDNVDRATQIEVLAKSPNWFGQGSRILLISNNRQLLEGYTDKIYEVQGLGYNDALRLFCLKAFKKDHPTKSYENLSREFVDYTQGHPLALEVFGSFLLKKELSVWECTLKQWKEEPCIEILEKLKISFDDLTYSQQELFLDIACFFNGEPKDDVMQYLKSVGNYPESNIEVLQDRSLVKVFYGNFRMHDLLQDMGHRIVCEKSLKNLAERSRLWSHNDIIYVLENNIGTEAVEGIFLRLPLPKPTKLNFEGFSKMKKLKLLVIRPTCFYQGDISNEKACKHLRTIEWYGNPSKFILSNELRVLEWWGYPLEYLPTNFKPNNLVELKIPMSNIKHLWNAKKDLEKLKYIDLRDSQNLIEMPDFSRVVNLEKLNVKRTGITQLSTIVLPDKLNVLNIGGSFSKPVSLVLHCLSLNLKFLVKLDLSYCNLTDGVLPNNLGCLSSLRRLDLSGNKITRIDCVSKLSSLTDLLLTDCERLKALPPKLSSRLSKIFLSHCRSLTTFSSPRDILASKETLVASDMTLQAIYFGYDGQHYCYTHVGQSLIDNSFLDASFYGGAEFFSAVTWGPTVTSDMPRWFTSLPDISGIFQRRFEAESRFKSVQGTRDWISEASLYYEIVANPSEYKGYDVVNCWGYVLFIVYEVLKHDSCRRGEIEEVDENGNFSSTIFPVFVCELEVHNIKDRKDPMGYYKTLGAVPIVFRVPDIPSIGRNGVWVFINADCFHDAGLTWCDGLGLCSISISSVNVDVKECGGRLVLKNDRSECFEVIKIISPPYLDPETLRKAFYNEGSFDNRLYICGPIIDGERGKRNKNCPWLTWSTSSEMLIGKDISEFEAFYFGYEGKRYRTYHLAQSIINYLPFLSLYPSFIRGGPPQTTHFATVAWGPTQTFDIPEWFTSLLDTSGIFQRRFEAEAQRGYLSLPCKRSSLYCNAEEEKWGKYEMPLMVSSWGYALFIVYEIFESDSCKRKGEIYEAEVDEYGNSSSEIFPMFVCEFEARRITKLEFPMYWLNEEVREEHRKTLRKVRIVFRVPDIPSVGRNGIWVFINGNCFREDHLDLGWWADPGLCSVSISSPNVDIKECGDRLVLKNDSSECYGVIKSISPHDLDSEILQDAFFEGGFGVFGDMIPGERRKEGKEQKGVEILQEGEEEGIEILEEGEEEGVEIFGEGEEEGLGICEKGEEV